MNWDADGWERTFAWWPTTLLTAEVAWLRPILRKKMDGYNPLWKPNRRWAFANLNRT